MVVKVIRGAKPHWVIDFRYTDKRGRRLRYRRDAEVQTHDSARREDLERQELARTTGSPFQQRTAAPTLAAFTEQWITIYGPRYRPETLIRYKALLGQGIREHFGHVPLDELAASHVVSYLAKLAERKVQARPHVNLIRTILKAAVEMGIISAIPTLPATPKTPTKIIDCPTREKIEHWVASSRGWLKLAVALAGYAAMRQGEIRALEARDIDLRTDTIRVRRALSGGDVLEPKGKKERLAPIAPQLRPLLVEALRERVGAARLIVRRTGGTPSRQSVLTRFKLLQGETSSWSFHSLRHHCLTHVLQHGADVRSVMELAGHSSLAVTQGYLHGSQQAIREAMAK